jgi:hypothetical protein
MAPVSAQALLPSADVLCNAMRCDAMTDEIRMVSLVLRRQV